MTRRQLRAAGLAVLVLATPAFAADDDLAGVDPDARGSGLGICSTAVDADARQEDTEARGRHFEHGGIANLSSTGMEVVSVV